MKTLNIISVISLLLLAASCSIFKPASHKKAEQKMNFTFDKLDNDGLIKNRGVSLAYEFCIPNETEYLDKIKSIDESIAVYKSSKGRIGCGENQILCIGETSGKDFESILIQLTNLPYVKSINESFFE